MRWALSDGLARDYNSALRVLVDLVDAPTVDIDNAQLAAVLTSVATVIVALAGLIRAVRSQPDPPSVHPSGEGS